MPHITFDQLKKPIQLTIVVALAICALSWPQLQIGIQPPQAQSAAVPFPLLPLIAEYEYVPHYFMQWLNDHPQYAMIEGSVSDGKQPVYSLVLTEKASRRRVTYSNLEEKVKGLTGAGQEARLTKIEYHATSKFGQPPAHEFSFTDERGQAIRWRFTLAAPASERGAGLTPQEGGAGWLLIYRDLGSTAGEGTVVQIGNKVCEAEAWTEISAPPYFVAYRGVYAEGMGLSVLPVGQENWRVTSSPKELGEGAQWTLTDERGRTRQWRIAARRGDELTINEVGSPYATRSLLVRQTSGGLALRSMTLTSAQNTMRLSFTPDLDLAAAAPIASAFQVDQNGHNKIVQGSVSGERKGGTVQLRWQPKTPDWAKTRVLNTTLTTNATSYKVEVR